MPYLTKQYKFCAAHRYWNKKWTAKKNKSVFADDVKIHGHNYKLDITISGPINSDSGFIMDIREINKIVKRKVLNSLDHSQIDKDIPWFKNRQPSTENLVVFIWKQIEAYFSNPIILYSIKLRETETIYTTYYGPGKHTHEKK
tara:strand:+ start:2909 stop:3337 length:429 start_codon:yes stop_codon:yes gene_type:complete